MADCAGLGTKGRDADLQTGSLAVRTRAGAALWIAASVQFVIGMAVTQLGWTAPYSLLHNYISDLGAVSCGYWPAGTTHYVCSPWHDVFNVSVALLGMLFAIGAFVVAPAFRHGRATSVGLVLVGVAGAGSVGVGLFPEDVDLIAHSVAALLAFAGGNVALILLGAAMAGDTRWRGGYRVFSIVCGAIGLVALVWYLSGYWGPVGLGGTERLILAPILLWTVVAGIRMIRRAPEAGSRSTPTAAKLPASGT